MSQSWLADGQFGEKHNKKKTNKQTTLPKLCTESESPPQDP